MPPSRLPSSVRFRGSGFERLFIRLLHSSARHGVQERVEALTLLSALTVGFGARSSVVTCTRYAKQAHANMRAHFGLNAQELPFVMFDPWDWDKPFSDANPELLDV